jgi:hypothetical protein
LPFHPFLIHQAIGIRNPNPDKPKKKYRQAPIDKEKNIHDGPDRSSARNIEYNFTIDIGPDSI